MAKTCIRVEACNIGSSERHNLRSKELDYIRPELTHRNEQSFSTIYFGGEHYWDIDELTKNKFSFYDRSGKFGDPFMNREYIELTPYQENNTTN